MLGCYRCSVCIACIQIKPGKYFVSNQTGSRFEFKYFLNCKSTFIIYMAECTCGKEYVGKTIPPFRRHVGEHLGDVCHNRDTPLARHIWLCQNGEVKDLNFAAIDHIRPNMRRGNRQKKTSYRGRPSGFCKLWPPVDLTDNYNSTASSKWYLIIIPLCTKYSISPTISVMPL